MWQIVATRSLRSSIRSPQPQAVPFADCETIAFGKWSKKNIATTMLRWMKSSVMKWFYSARPSAEPGVFSG